MANSTATLKVIDMETKKLTRKEADALIATIRSATKGEMPSKVSEVASAPLHKFDRPRVELELGYAWTRIQWSETF